MSSLIQTLVRVGYYRARVQKYGAEGPLGGYNNMKPRGVERYMG
jgi:hypothetical protein